jgi:arylamine N-acetyltransferase
VTTSPDIPGYLGRLGLPIGSPASWPAPDLATLRDLVARHVLRVPFENASVLRGEPIVLDPAALVGRLVGTRRGGFCYQLNGAFSSLLVALGYEVELLAARFHSEPAMEPRFGHLAMRVSLDDVPWLVDVGGGLSFRQPLRIETGVEQDDPAGCFRLDAARDTDQEEGERPIDVEWRHRDGVSAPTTGSRRRPGSSTSSRPPANGPVRRRPHRSRAAGSAPWPHRPVGPPSMAAGSG